MLMEVRNRKKLHVGNLKNIETKDCSKEETAYIRRGLVFLCCVIVTMCNYYHASIMHENHIMFSHLSTMEREMSFRTEMGFYYSFYKQVVEAPSIQASFHLLTKDNLTEYPLTINALYRFNVYPELIIGIIYRSFIQIADFYGVEIRTCYSVNRHNLPPVQSCEGLGEPAIFYVHMVMLLNGIMMTFFFLIAYQISGYSILGGLISCLFFFYNHRECTRVQWTPPLRESFSYPFIFIQQFFLLQLFTQSRPSKLYSMSKYGFLLSTLMALLSWQFAQFSFLTQCIAIFLSYVVAGDCSKKSTTQNILILLFIADFINLILQFGNTLLLVGPLRPCIIMALIIVTFEPLSLRSRFHNSRWCPLRWILLTVVLLFSTFLLKFILSIVLQIKSDDHMFDILKSKFSNFRSFDSLLYTCAAEFDFYDMSSLPELTYTGLLPIASTIFLSIVLYSLGKWFHLFFSSNKSGLETANFLTSSGLCKMETYYLFFQMIAYSLMAALIMRLKLFWTPQLCIIAAFMWNKDWPLLSFIEYISNKIPTFGNLSKRHNLHRIWPLILIVALCSIRGVNNIKSEWDIKGAYANWEQEQLMGVIIDRTLPEDSFVGQMAIMATVRLVTGRPITMHPHYEDEYLRKRVHMSYAVFSRKPIHDVWYMFRSELQGTYLIYEQAYCSLRPGKPGCSYLEMWNLVDPINASKESLCVHFNNYISDMRMGQKSVSGGISRYFKWKFTTDNGAFTLFEIRPLPLS